MTITPTLRSLICLAVYGGHEFYRTWSSDRLYQTCIRCQYRTAGWDVTPALRFRSTWMRAKGNP